MADRVVVATDDRRVVEAVAGLGVEGLLTVGNHGTGTERVAEIAARPAYRTADVILNVQGDEPFVAREALTGAVGQVERHDVGTAAATLEEDAVGDPNRVKVQVDRDGRALRFARRLPQGESQANDWHQHVGIYAYRPEALERWMDAAPTPEESVERLEQLRALALGLTMGVATMPWPAAPGIDTESDLCAADQYLTALSRR